MSERPLPEILARQRGSHNLTDQAQRVYFLNTKNASGNRFRRQEIWLKMGFDERTGILEFSETEGNRFEVAWCGTAGVQFGVVML
ncbi:MAG: hypothetical protein CMJ65_14340 [Planctomycetaceae bacterium]|nr:hypothetical protein [Planctomycetaceae bacterium]